jgi:hypothetical protein
MRTSSCVDCGTTIIGERLRCPACHMTHASALRMRPIEEDQPPMIAVRLAQLIVLMVTVGFVLLVLRVLWGLYDRG